MKKLRKWKLKVVPEAGSDIARIQISVKRGGVCMRYLILALVCIAFTVSSDDNDWLMESLRSTLVDLNEKVSEEYELLLEENLEAAGTITLEFRIMPDGAIWDLSVTADSVLAPLIPLIDSLLNDIKIDLSQPIQASIPVVVPLELKPGD